MQLNPFLSWFVPVRGMLSTRTALAIPSNKSGVSLYKSTRPSCRCLRGPVQVIRSHAREYGELHGFANTAGMHSVVPIPSCAWCFQTMISLSNRDSRVLADDERPNAMDFGPYAVHARQDVPHAHGRILHRSMPLPMILLQHPIHPLCCAVPVRTQVISS